MSRNSRIANIPYPSNDSVVYSRKSTNAFWENRRAHALSTIPSSLNFNFEDGRIE